MRVLVTGGAGFIGSALVRHLVGVVGAEVLNIDKLTYASTLSSLRTIEGKPGYRFLKADVCNGQAIADAFASFRPDRVMHLAAESHVDRSIDAPIDFVRTNVTGTVTLLNAARGYYESLDAEKCAEFRFLHISTDEVFGSLGNSGVFTEHSRYDPSSPYSASKAAADHMVRAWARTYGLPAIVSNCTNNYGPYQFPEKLIPLVILNAIEGTEIPVYGSGENVRDWLFVNDHVEALELIAAKGRIGETYNVGGRAERRNIEVVHEICDNLDRLRPDGAPHRRLIRFVTDRPGHDARYAIDPSKLETELGWVPKESFATGLGKTVAWYLDNPWWWQSLRGGEGYQRLGLMTAQGDSST